MRRRDFLGSATAAAFGPRVRSENAPAPFWFVDVARQAGLVHPVVYGGVDQKKYIIETNGCGIAFLDYDNDGWLDIFVPGGSRIDGAPTGATNRLYKNNRDGTFTDVTKRAGLERVVWASGVCIGDYDNDGYDDLFLSCWGQNILYHNNGNGTFTDVTKEAKLLHSAPQWGAGCTFVDYNRDGHLDLFVSTYLNFDYKTTPLPGATENCMWKGIAVNCGPKGLPTGRNFLFRNNGNGTFTDVSEESGISKPDHRYAMTAVAADFDDDGWPDIFVACDSTPSILYKNRHDGTFADVALEGGVAFNEDGRAQAGMGVAVGDATGGGRMDIFKTHFADDTPILYRNKGNCMFDDMTSRAGFGALTRYIGWGAGLQDFDNNGIPDLLYVNGSVYPEVEKYFGDFKHANPRIALQNLGRGVFQNVSELSGPGITEVHSSRGCAFGDFDNDGDVDAVVMNMNEAPSLLRNDSKNGNHWLKVKLVGTKSNRTAIGASVRITAAARQQRQDVLGQSSFYSQNDLRLHFGLGAANRIDLLEVRWPSGSAQTYKDVPADQILVIKEKA